MSVAPEVNVNELLKLMMGTDLVQSEILRQKCKDACQHLARAMQEVRKEAQRRQNWPPTIQRIYESVLEMTTDGFARFDTIDVGNLVRAPQFNSKCRQFKANLVL
uniref:Uncharacterized protein n=1 Tax=Trichuris muris TaxID=70415 RepID=A0A5S6QBG3_TRIMR